MNFSVEKSCNPHKSSIKALSKDNVFFNYDFLSALETSNSLNPNTGWMPNSFKHQNGSIIPFYKKNNSQGEFVFDYAWANAYFKSGIKYYPKIVLSVPFTPVEGERIFCSDDNKGEEALRDFTNYVNESNFSSIHALYVEEESANPFLANDYIERIDCNYKWHNHNYNTFDDYLISLKSRYRKNILRERQSINEQGITFNVVQQPSDKDWEEFYLFYALTYVRRGQNPYLTLDFFKQINSLNPIILFAKRKQEKVAAALFFIKKDSLYGRYWGAKEDINFLHFETCYYQGIELAIEKGIKTFDPGIQGQHKLKRGFEPVITRSYHWIKHPEFRKAIINYCKEEGRHVLEYLENAKKQLPFKNV